MNVINELLCIVYIEFKPSFAPAVGRISESGSNDRLNKGLYDFAKAFFRCGRPLGGLKT